MNNAEFLEKVKEAFYKYLETGSRSNEKLKILHGAIAYDLQEKLGESYEIHSLGFKDDKEIKMTGRYMNKKVDIAINKNGETKAAIALKYIMRNYSQNSNNYFENMLGETANIRSAGKPYFQIVIIPSTIPYFENTGKIRKTEKITYHNLTKYINLSNDNIDVYMHTPNKTLIYLVDIPEIPKNITDFNEYIKYYQKQKIVTLGEDEKTYKFGDNVVYNNYETFIQKIVYSILSI